jgi:protein-disulfide isomerase
MSSHTDASRRPLFLIVLAITAALLGFLGGFAVQWTSWGKDATGKAVHAYLLEHPEVLPEAMQRLQQKEMAARLEPLRAQVARPFPGAVLGNPKGRKVLVEFSDYACGYCRQSVAEVDALIAADPDLMVVIREYPILSKDSEDAARMALAAAEQGKFAAFHRAMFAAGRPSAQTIGAAAKQAGLDMPRAEAFLRAGKAEQELAMNMRLAEALGFSGTPSWVAGKEVFAGAVGRAALAAALGK